MPEKPLIALVMTIKNEATLLRNNLLYHKFLGVDRAYIFDDGSTDNSSEVVKDLEFVRFQPSVDAQPFLDMPELKIFTDNIKTHHPARQALNVHSASEHARGDGFDWIISIDVDELICLHPEVANQGDLKKFFAELDSDIEAVVFSNMEVVQRKSAYNNVFAEETLFKIRGAKIQKKMLDPLNKETFKISGFYGQTKGKSAVKLSVPAKHGTVHKFVHLKDESSLKTFHKANGLLHYYIYDFEDFMRHTKNYVKLKNKRIRGSTVERQKQVWRDFVNHSDVSDEEIFGYYKTSIMYSNKEIGALTKNRIFGIFPTAPKAVEISSVKSAFSEALSGSI